MGLYIVLVEGDGKKEEPDRRGNYIRYSNPQDTAVQKQYGQKYKVEIAGNTTG